MKGLKYGICFLILLGGLSACSLHRRVVRDVKDNSRVVSEDTVRESGRVGIDSVRIEQVGETRDSVREVEDTRVEVEYNDIGKPAVIKIHRERTSAARGRTVEKTESVSVIRDTASVSVHVGGSERTVETVSHERTTRRIGAGKWSVLLAMAGLLLILISYLNKNRIWRAIRSIFFGL